ncbi:SMI1/KNR4 family protein [Nostoc sp. LEGE 06077]|uniref:SMI1/KNR4 family protein n=1 Tax=Nostoc sp. LEGE 06077 TaxID=915325 RepID=UPI0018806738|nr:SMI1/KNR4 family protein [Nostoc sp. LEGE 06077]MBE9206856.1 SMI1/KNR4 family protein [Nostoc sp. LEGE 06077]
MSALTDALDRILSWLEEYNNLDFARFESLQPGLKFAEIEEKVSSLLPLRLPKEVYELYQWGNGVWLDEEIYGRFFENYVFLSLETSLATYYEMTTINEEIDECNLIIKQNWNSLWFPILKDLDGRGYYVVLIHEIQKDTTPVIRVDFEEMGDYPYIIYPTLTNMMLAEAECYTSEIYSKFAYEEEYIRQKYQDIPMKIWRN